MRAFVMNRYGGPEVTSFADRPEPEVRRRDVLIEVRAASLNPVDFKLREHKVWPVLRPRLPLIMGCDVAGVVRAVGPDVQGFAPGDEVYARLEKERMGALAERVATDFSVVAKKPSQASFEEAAALPLVCLTALQALREAAGLTAGQRVLVHAGAGGVGAHAIQLAKILGLHVATTTSGKNADFVRELGAEEVIDYTQENVADRVRDLDAVFDTLGGESELTSLSLVRRGGVVVGVSGMPNPGFDMLPWWAKPAVYFATRRRTKAAAARGVRFAYLFMRADGAQLTEIAAWVDAGKLRPIVFRTYPFAEVPAAFAELERGHARGKIVIAMQ